jgi:hypothetical protein
MSQIKERPGSLWFPVHVLQKQVEAADPALNILLMHHPLAWFQPEVRREFAGLIDSAFTVVLAGHEHQPEAWERDDLIGNKTLIVEGGVFQERHDRLIGSTFNLLSIDLDQRDIQVLSHEFDGKRYVPGVVRISQFANALHIVKPYRQLSDKCSSFMNSAGATFRHPRKASCRDVEQTWGR